MPYRAAVVGCGQIGLLFDEDSSQIRPATHTAALSMNPRTELVALVDDKPEKLQRAAERYPGVPRFADCGEMLEAVRPELVAVATPPETHRKLVEQCATGGVRAIVCEKPIALDLEDARRMVDGCAAAGVLLFVNHTRRFDPLIRRAREAVAAGAIGDVLQAMCVYTRGVMNNGTHLLDLLRFFLGDATAVWGVSKGSVDVPLPEDMAVDGRVEFAGGALATIHHVDDGVFDVTLIGHRGELALTQVGFRLEWTYVRRRADGSGELDPAERRAEGEQRSFMAAMVDHVVACCDGREKPVSRGEDGRAALALVWALRKSADLGGVRVPVAAERSGK